MIKVKHETDTDHGLVSETSPVGRASSHGAPCARRIAGGRFSGRLPSPRARVLRCAAVAPLLVSSFKKYFSDIQHNEITNVEEYPNRSRKALRTRDRGARRGQHGRQSAVTRRPARGFTGPPRSGGSAPSQARYGTQLRGVRTGRRREAPHPPPACSAEPSDMRADLH